VTDWSPHTPDGAARRKDVGIGDGGIPLQYVRSHLVIASRAAGIAPPIDSVYPHLRDTDGLARQATHSRSLGFGGKSAIHPSQLPIIHTAFSSSEDELAWARKVVNIFAESGGAAVQLPDGEFVDLPVAERARGILQSTEGATWPAFRNRR
jgi:citrate lyase subunit beta/citryl-CoA lyase